MIFIIGTPNVPGHPLPRDYVRKLGEKIGRHPTTDDVAWSLRGGHLGWRGTGKQTPAPHLKEESYAEV